jgi:hypothetical protein
MVVYGGLIYYSTDNGNNWKYLSNGLPNNNVFQSLFVNDSNIFVGSDFSGMWHYPLSQLITGVTNVKSKIPQGFELKQNYPNPFSSRGGSAYGGNPSTIISYQLPMISLPTGQAGFVTLKVYDVLGREVKILVNEYQTAGTHSLTFNANGLPSGIYFYRISAGSYSDTKKLVLLK